jgi:DnaK suppressor protein
MQILRPDPRRVLQARRQETLRDLRQRLQDARDEWTWTNQVRDTADSSELHGREDIELGLIRLKVDTLERINEALTRVDNGTYGLCVDCQSTISGPRLRALPFAARCKTCAKRRVNAPDRQSARSSSGSQYLHQLTRCLTGKPDNAERWKCAEGDTDGYV